MTPVALPIVVAFPCRLVRLASLAQRGDEGGVRARDPPADAATDRARRVLAEEVAGLQVARRPDRPRHEAAAAVRAGVEQDARHAVAQKVHSKLQMRASVDSGGSGRLQCSQVGRSSSMVEA